jgi:hypothetical protein
MWRKRQCLSQFVAGSWLATFRGSVNGLIGSSAPNFMLELLHDTVAEAMLMVLWKTTTMEYS